VSLSASSMIWYWPKDGDALWLGRQPRLSQSNAAYRRVYDSRQLPDDCQQTVINISSSHNARVTSMCSTWNHPPPALRSPDLSQSAFKRALKTHLFSTAGAIETSSWFWRRIQFRLTYLLTLAFKPITQLRKWPPWEVGRKSATLWVHLVVVFNYLLVTQCYTEDVFCQQRLSWQNQHRAWARVH